MKATRFVSSEEKTAIETAVANAEKQTSAEIVCAVATESGRYDRAEAIVGFACALIGLWVTHMVAGASATTWSPVAVPLPWQMVGVCVGFIAGNVLASFAHPLRRLVTSTREMTEESTRAAAHVFHAQRMTSTRARGGLLIYVSLFERQAHVVADDGALGVLGREGIEALRDVALTRLKAGNRAATFIDTAAAAGERLAAGLPHEPDDTDELSNELRVLHPRP
jgi:putative membrane protein